MPLNLFWKLTEMEPTPNARAVTVPAETLKRDELDDAHVASAVTSLVVPSENIAAAVSWLVSPTARSTLFPVTRIEVSAVTGADVGVGVCVGDGSTRRGGSPPHERLAAARMAVKGPRNALRAPSLKLFQGICDRLYGAVFNPEAHGTDQNNRPMPM